MSELRILGVIVNLVPYHVARWSAVVEAGHQVTLLQRRAGDPFAVLATESDGAPFRVHTLADPQAGAPSWREQVLGWIDRLNPQVLVVSGYSFPESLAALLAAEEVIVERMTKNGLRTFDVRGALCAARVMPNTALVHEDGWRAHSNGRHLMREAIRGQSVPMKGLSNT